MIRSKSRVLKLSVFNTWNDELLENQVTKSKITKDENRENKFHLETTEVVLVQCNILSNDYQHDSRVLFRLVPNKSFNNLLYISLKGFIYLNTLNSEIL